MIITIDGPSGSGKSTLALHLAKELHFFCMNSGYLYRGVSYILKNFYGYDTYRMQNPDINDVRAILASDKLEYSYEYGIAKLYWIDDITIFLKDPEISKLATIIAQNDVIRAAIKTYEKSLVSSRDSVVEGRACGSVMYPHAEIKLYLEAPVLIRARRLQGDQSKRGVMLSLEQAVEQIEKRDFVDKNRATDPLQIPQGAIILDSSKYNPDELLELALDYVKKYFQKK